MNVVSDTNIETYYSNGKLLISGEYLVLKGAKALAFPVKFGQKIQVYKSDKFDGIHWESYMYEDLWFYAYLSYDLKIIETNKIEIAERLKNILLVSKEMNNEFLKDNESLKVKSRSNFDFGWGIGSSSTLISNVAFWANIDPYELNRRIFGGSGFDIACSRNNKPFIFQLESNNHEIEKVQFNPVFKDKVLFVYLGNKQNTQSSIQSFQNNASFKQNDIERISGLTEELADCQDIEVFMNALIKHEQIISHVLGTERIQDKYFKDFKGVVKSLGSWGGDFVMAVSQNSNEYMEQYFSNKGLDTFFTFEEISIK